LTERVEQAMAGQTIAELFAQRGEEAFRQLEREALARDSTRDDRWL
jgi:shikimate kinase